MRRVLVLAAVLLGGLLAAPNGSAEDPAEAAAAGKSGKAKKKCKKGQAKLKSGKRTLCVRVPKSTGTVTPRDEDPRLAAITAGLTPPILSTPDPKDELPPPMEKVYRSFGPQALSGMEKAVAGSLVKLDAAATRSRLLGRAGWASPSASNGNGYSETFGNIRIDIRLNIARVASAEFALTRTHEDGRTISTTYEIPFLPSGYDGFHGDTCPDAAGKLKAKDGLGISMRIEVRSNGGKTLDEYLNYKVIDKTDLRAEVGDDAKLDRLEINNIQEVWETVYGSSTYSGAQVRATIVREGTVDMRKGDSLNTTINNVDAAVSLAGIAALFPSSARAGIVQRMKKAADEAWKAIVKVEIEKFRELEKGWNNPNQCAKIVYGKANRSLTFHRNDAGTETARVDAKPGGSPAKATWELKDATTQVTPPSGTANPGTFSFKVVNAGNGFEVKVTLKAVSKAGVAEESWIQKTEETSVLEIVGTFTKRVDFGGSVFDYAGNARFVRSVPAVVGPVDGAFLLVSGLVTFTASGNANQIGIGPECSMRGSSQFALQTGSPFIVFSQKFDGLPPFEYTYNFGPEFVSGLPPIVDIEAFACSGTASKHEGEHLPRPTEFALFTSTPLVSADGHIYTGAVTDEQGPLTITETWSFEGKP